MPRTWRRNKQTDFAPDASSATDEPRQTGPLGERLTDAELRPIRVYAKAGTWWVDYGGYAPGHHDSREQAIEAALKDAVWENRELLIERPRKISETMQTATGARHDRGGTGPALRPIARGEVRGVDEERAEGIALMVRAIEMTLADVEARDDADSREDLATLRYMREAWRERLQICVREVVSQSRS